MERVPFSLSVSFAMVQVQRHECRPKKCFGKCEEGDPKVRRYGYPRERCDEDLGRSETTGRYIYRCEDKEDERLAASCSRLVDENGPAPSTGGRREVSTWQLQLSHWACRVTYGAAQPTTSVDPVGIHFCPEDLTWCPLAMNPPNYRPRLRYRRSKKGNGRARGGHPYC